MLTDEELFERKQTTINALMEGDDIKGDRDAARIFLATLMDMSPHEAIRVVVPIGRRLLGCNDWETWNIDYIVDYCLKFIPALEEMRAFSTDEIDPEVTLMCGMCLDLVEHFENEKPVNAQ